MRIAVLGPLEVLTDDSVPVPLRGAEERLLLALLVAGGPGPVSADQLVETFGNGDSPDAARESLQVHLGHLRSALEPGLPERASGRYVLRRGPGYVLAVPHADIDAQRFGDLVARARARLDAGDAEEA